jgi:hypothetical protein
MKKILMYIMVATSLLACNESKKDGWSDEDKRKSIENLNDEFFKVSGIGDKKQDYIDCFLENIEKNYDSYEEAEKDPTVTLKIADYCLNKVR